VSPLLQDMSLTVLPRFANGPYWKPFVSVYDLSGTGCAWFVAELSGIPWVGILGCEPGFSPLLLGTGHRQGVQAVGEGMGIVPVSKEEVGRGTGIAPVSMEEVPLAPEVVKPDPDVTAELGVVVIFDMVVYSDAVAGGVGCTVVDVTVVVDAVMVFPPGNLCVKKYKDQ